MARWSRPASIPGRDVLTPVAVVSLLIVLFSAPQLTTGPATAAKMIQGGFTTSATISTANVSPGGRSASPRA